MQVGSHGYFLGEGLFELGCDTQVEFSQLDEWRWRRGWQAGTPCARGQRHALFQERQAVGVAGAPGVRVGI